MVVVVLCLLAGVGALGVSPAAAKVRPPKPVPAWYMTAANVTDLTRQAKHSACEFAKRQPKGPRLLLFDFGAAQKYRDGTFGASLREIRRFRNGGILKALKAAARTYHRCHRKGSVTIAYGNTNSIPGYMSKADAREAGLHQALTVKRLKRFQNKERHFRHQSAASAGDIEPGFAFPGISKALVDGANGGTPYYDFGNAGGCPGQPGGQGCYNDWDLGDLGEVSVGGRSLSLPEIYHSYEATQWARVQRRWPGDYAFEGVTGSPIEPLTPSGGWTALKRRADHVGRELVTIRNAGSRASSGGSNSAGTAALGGPMTGTTPPHLVSSPEPFFSTSLIYPITSSWVASGHRRFVAVEAGADPVHPATGVLGIFRQNYMRVTQSQRIVKVPGSGTLRLSDAPPGRGKAALEGSATAVRFTSERGVGGTLDLMSGKVSMDPGGGGSR